MRILLINPNTSTFMTERMTASAIDALPPDVELVAKTATQGMPYIASRAESVLAGATTLEMIAAHKAGMDAVVIGAFGDPGLIAARELFDLPISGMAEAAILTACMLGPRFAIVSFTPVMIPWYEDSVALSGLEGRFAGISVPDVAFRSIENVQSELEAELVELCLQAVTRDKADVIILAGAPLTGLARKVADRVPVPLVDPLDAAIGQAALLARLGTRMPEAGRFRRPPAKPATGVSPALRAWIEHRPLGEA
ncbi:aspartate/glutamate racemase family protein [Xanthobacteraceae bacterium A53D]